MRQFTHGLFWASCAGFVLIATRAERAEAAVCSTVGAGPVCGYGYDVACNPLTFECKPIIYEYREVINRPISGPDPY